MRRARTKRELIYTTEVRKIVYLGYILRGIKYSLLQQITQDRIEGRLSASRP